MLARRHLALHDRGRAEGFLVEPHLIALGHAVDAQKALALRRLGAGRACRIGRWSGPFGVAVGCGAGLGGAGRRGAAVSRGRLAIVLPLQQRQAKHHEGARRARQHQRHEEPLEPAALLARGVGTAGGAPRRQLR